jgi:hypothetical protein
MADDNSPSKTKDIIDAATGLVKAVPVYDDLLQPSMKEVSKSLKTVAEAINVALSPVKGLIWGYEQLEKFLLTNVAEKLKHIPPERICSPKPNLAGPTLEALKYSGHDEYLREMFAKLLATALDSETTGKAHPAFVEIIKQLNSKEAKLITYLAGRLNFPEICEYKDIKDMKRSGLFVSPGLLTNSYINLREEFAELCDAVGITIGAFSVLDNLKRLQLIEFIEDNEFSVGKKSDGGFLFSSSEDGEIRNEIYHTESLAFTSFGTQFVEVCIKEQGT